MATFDTGAIDNRQEPVTSRLTVRLTNTGKQQAIAGIELYHVEPDGGGSGSQTFYHVSLVALAPYGQAGSTFTVENAYAAFDVIGVRIVTSGLGGSDVTAVVEELNEAGSLIGRRLLGGELSQANPQILAYVATNDSGSVEIEGMPVVDTFNNTLLTTVPSLNHLSDAAIAPDGTRVYATDAFAIYVVDTSTNTIADTYSLPPGAILAFLTIMPDGLTAYGLNPSVNSVYVIDLVNGSITDTIVLSPDGQLPVAIAISPDGLHVYTANQNSSTVSVIDTTTNTVVSTIDLGDFLSLNDLVVSPDGSKLYVTSNNDNSVYVIDTATNTVVTTINVGTGTGPYTIAITPDGSKLYTANRNNNSIAYINAIGNTIIGTIPFEIAGTSVTPRYLAVTPDGSRLYIAGNNFGGISGVAVLDTFSNTLTGSMPLGYPPTAICMTPILLF